MFVNGIRCQSIKVLRPVICRLHDICSWGFFSSSRKETPGQEPFAERRGGGGAPPAGGACFSGNAHPRTPSEDGLGSDLKQAATKGGPGAKRKRSGWPCWLGATPLGRRNPGTEGSS